MSVIKQDRAADWLGGEIGKLMVNLARQRVAMRRPSCFGLAVLEAWPEWNPDGVVLETWYTCPGKRPDFVPEVDCPAYKDCTK